jgi:adenosylcobinamide-GDP ribazoletransferase
MGLLGRELRHFFVGIMFLTRLPVPTDLRHVEGALARSARYFPIVGVLIGAMTGGVFMLVSWFLPAPIAAGLALAAGLLITGALHEDGFADTCDGLGGGATREHALEIMRDSRIGTYGAAALIMSIGLRWATLAQLSPTQGLSALIICHAISRGMIPPVLVSAGYARTRGLASSVAEGVTGAEAVVAILLTLAVAMIVGPAAGLGAFATAVGASGIMLAILVRKLGGYTGDGLGAIQQMAEIATLMFFAGFWL